MIFLTLSMVSVNFFTNAQLPLFKINACIIGLGAFFERDWFYYNILVDGFSDFHFKYKENICVVLSACRWCHTWYNKIVFVYCDNTAAVDMLNKDTTKSPTIMHFLGDCLGSLRYIISILKPSMLQGTTKFWLTMLPASMNFCICRVSCHICWVAAPMQLTFLLFPICQSVATFFGLLELIPCLSFSFSVTICFAFHSL